MNFAFYKDDGTIYSITGTPGDEAQYQDMLERGLNVAKAPPEMMSDWGAYIVRDGVVVPRDPFPGEATIDGNALHVTGVPPGTEMIIWFENHMIWREIVDDGELEASLPDPGVFTITAEITPYAFWKIQVEITA